MAGIVTEAARKIEYAAAATAEPSQAAKAAAAQTALQEHYCRVFKSWAAAARTDAHVAEDSCSVSEALIDPKVLNAWEADLSEAGYAVTRAAGRFRAATR